MFSCNTFIWNINWENILLLLIFLFWWWITLTLNNLPLLLFWIRLIWFPTIIVYYALKPILSLLAYVGHVSSRSTVWLVNQVEFYNLWILRYFIYKLSILVTFFCIHSIFWKVVGIFCCCFVCFLLFLTQTQRTATFFRNKTTSVFVFVFAFVFHSRLNLIQKCEMYAESTATKMALKPNNYIQKAS